MLSEAAQQVHHTNHLLFHAKVNFNASVGRKFLPHSIIPIARETFKDTDATCSLHFNWLSI